MEAKKIIQSLRKRRAYFPYIIFTFGIVLTLAVAMYLYQISRVDDRHRFYNRAERVKESIANRIETYTALLRAGSGLFAGSAFVSRDEFKAFADQLSLKDKYRGVQGIGFSLRIPSGEKDRVTQMMREQGMSNFSIYPDTLRNEYHTIIYLEPLDRRNAVAIGYDMFTNPIRREAMEKARDTGLPAASRKVRLVQEIDSQKQPGFLIYVPVYKDGTVPKTIEERRADLTGYVYSPFRAYDLLDVIYKAERADDVRLVIYDGDATENNLLYESKKLEGTLQNHHPLYSRNVEVTIAGRSWTLSFMSLPAFEQASETRFIPYILLIGFVASGMLFLITRLQVKTRQEAITLAEDLLASESALRSSNRQIKNIFKSITDGFMAFDRHWNFTYVNEEGAKTLGRTPEAILGKNLWKEFPAFEGTTFGKLFRQVAKGRRPVTREDYYSPFKRWFSVRAYPARNGISIYFQDISERVQLERQKDEFLGIASHELKTPVTSLKSYAQVLQRRFIKNGDSASADHLAKMNGQLDKLTRLIGDLLDVTKIEAGKMQFVEETFDYNKLVWAIVEELQRTTDQHTIVIEGSVTVPVHGDRERIGQVLSNLITNAIKYSPEADKIIVSLTQKTTSVTTCVKDFGVGIPSEHRSRVFDRFFRVSGPKSETFPGLGLGLYISSQIVKRHNGKIWMTSTQGTGSTFCYTVPLKKKKEKAV